MGDANARYKPKKQVRFKTSMLGSDLCDFSDAYIVVKGDITLTKAENRDYTDVRKRFLTLKNNPPFTNCISKINNAAMGIGGGILQCPHKCCPMLVLQWQKNAVVKVFTYAVFLFRFCSVVDNS